MWKFDFGSDIKIQVENLVLSFLCMLYVVKGLFKLLHYGLEGKKSFYSGKRINVKLLFLFCENNVLFGLLSGECWVTMCTTWFLGIAQLFVIQSMF